MFKLLRTTIEVYLFVKAVKRTYAMGYKLAYKLVTR